MKRVDTSSTAAEQRWPANPYPGLRPFLITEDSDESLIFFGRKEQVHDLLDRLGDTHFMAVLGPSGCGKSSLVKAGMIPALSSGLIYQAGANWVSAEAEPGSTTIQNLARAIADALSRAQRKDAAGRTPSAEALAERMHGSTSALVDLAEELPQLLEDNTNLLILVDQFEEIFREDLAQRDEDAQLINLLLNVFYMRPEGLYVVITMRTDYLEQCATFHGLPEALNQSQFLTPRLNAQQLADSISGPAELLQYGGKVEPLLARKILDEMTGSSGYDPDLLPLMQHALFWMWTKAAGAERKKDEPVTLTLEAYQDLVGDGGLQGVLSRRADDIFLRSLDAEQQRIAECMFRLMSEVDDGARRRRRVTTPEEVARNAGVDLAAAREVIDVFADDAVNFIRWKDDGATLDVTHESLIRKWDRLDGWALDERVDAEEYRDLERATAKWAQDNRATLTEAGLLRWDEFQQRKGNVELWSKRYGSAFGEVSEYVSVSRARVKESKESRENAQRLQAEVEEAAEQAKAASQRTRRLSAVIAVVLLLAGGTVWGWITAFDEKNRVQEQADLLRRNAEALKVKSKEADDAKLAAEAEALRLRQSSDRNARLVKVSLKAITLRRAAIMEKEVDEGRPATALRLGLDTKDIATVDDQAFHLALARAATAAPQPGAELIGRFGEISSVRWREEGGGWVSHWQNGQLNQVDAPNELSRPFEITSAQRFVPGGLSPDRTKALVTTKPGTAALVDAFNAGEPVWLVDHPGEAVGAQFSEDGTSIASLTRDNQVGVWDAETGDVLAKLTGVAADLFSLSADGTHLVTANHSGDGEAAAASTAVRVWKLRPDAWFVYNTEVPGTVTSLNASHDGSAVALGLAEGTVNLLTDNGQNVVPVAAHNRPVYAIAFSRDAKLLASGSSVGELSLWTLEAESPKLVRKAAVASGAIRHIEFSPDGREIVAKLRTRLHVVEASTLSPKAFVQPDGRPVALSSDGNRVLTTWHDGPSWLWDVSTGARLGTIKKPDPEAVTLSAAFSFDAKKVATAYWDGTILISSSKNGSEISRLDKQPGRIISLAFSPDDARLVLYSTSGSVRTRVVHVRDAATGAIVIRQVLSDGSGSFGFSTDGRWFFAQTAKKSIRVWNAVSGELVTDIQQRTEKFKKAVLFTQPRGPNEADAIFLATTTGRVTRVWDVATGRPVYRAVPHQTAIQHLAVNADGSVLMTLSREEARLWRLPAKTSNRTNLSRIGRARGENLYVGVFDRDGGSNFTLFSVGTRRVRRASTQAGVRRSSSMTSTMSYWAAQQIVRSGSSGQRSSLRLVRRAEVFGPVLFSGKALSWHSPHHLTALTENEGRVQTWRLPRGSKSHALDGSGSAIQLKNNPSWAEFTSEKSLVVHHRGGLSRFQGVQDEPSTWTNLWDGLPHLLAPNRGFIADLSSDGKFVVAPSRRSSAIVVDAQNGARIATLDADRGRVNSAVFDEAGRKILTTHDDAVARLWSFDPDAGEAKLIKNYVFGTPGTKGLVSGYFDPSGRYFVTLARDGTIAVWSTSTRSPLGTLAAPTSKYVYAVGFTSDGACIFVENGDGQIKLINRDELTEDCLSPQTDGEARSPFLAGYRLLNYVFDRGKKLVAVSGSSAVGAGGARHSVFAIYSAQTGKPVAVWKEPRASFAGWANWSANGSKLAVPMGNGWIHILKRPKLDSWEALIGFAERAAKPALSKADRRRLKLLDVDEVIRLAN